MIKYHCEWFEPFYEADESWETIDWFTNDLGYEDEVIQLLPKLDLNEPTMVGFGHRITKVEVL
jgi:hypothetical protein